MRRTSSSPGETETGAGGAAGGLHGDLRRREVGASRGRLLGEGLRLAYQSAAPNKRGATLSDRPRTDGARSQEGYFFFLAAFFVDFLAAFFVAFFLAAFFAMRNHPLRGM